MSVLSREEGTAALAAFHEKLRRARDRGLEHFEELMLNSPPGLGFHEIDVNHVVTRVSPEELRILGYTKAQMVGRPVWEFIVMQEAAQRAIKQKLDGSRELKPFVRTFRRADGTAVPMLLMDDYLRDAAGNPVGIRTAMTETPQI
jgi:PAS domain S-box-containing protein